MSLSVVRREEYAVEVKEQEKLVTCWIAFGLRLKWGRSHYPSCLHNTVPFRLIRPSRVTGPVVLAEFGHLSRVTTPMANDFWWIQKTVKKAFKKIFTGVGHMQHFVLLIYLRRTVLIDQ